MLRKLVFAAAVVLAVGGGFLVGQTFYERTQPPDVPALLWPDPKALGAFALEDHEGRPFDRARLEGKWSFLFFGYSHCPDVCPTTLATFDAIKERLGDPARDAVQFVFVSVDPRRDTPARLGEYVGYFDADFVGATARREKLQGLTDQFGVFYELGEPDAAGEYTVAHSAAIMLVDPRARLIGLFRAPHEAARVASQFRRIRDFVGSRDAG